MIKREKVELVKKSVIFVGIDVASNRHYARFIDNLGQEVIKGISFSNDREGFLKLENHINQIGNSDHNIIFSLEPSGDWWKPIGYWLKKKGWSVVLVNPYHLNRTKEIIDNSQDKRDDKDSYLIADLTKQGKYFFPIIPEGVYAELREVGTAYLRTNKEIVMKKCYLINFLVKYFPEYRRIFSDILGKSSLYILSHYPLPEDIKRLGLKRLGEILKKVSRGKIKEGKIRELYNKAVNSIGIKEGKESAKFFLKEILRDIKRLIERKKEIKGIMERLLS